ncbi:hypothetical protein PPL_07248 [Heterostelium album PN500]|uniref:F-box domain-containing protein n=1 Tax=Heterostelium pallidum (strain ATCC 26659 / Pp 5 / PN500) TaxID=670386 RepID=D3BET3_HETP5|nr:hypothetical protein PPL_07248 [Heterostelium album PN500]EFA80414.1 hypothetical protein PPL_07248 [Heterostelium album PN500]|eukprot:XP_020432534.1 hypothetical protein PPL_07248 [Heterostelium album PN500]
MNELDKLPHLIIKYILSYLDSNIDRVCLILASKVWYDDVDRLLFLNDRHLPSLLSYKRQQKQKRVLKHFRNVIDRSMMRKIPIIQYMATNEDEPNQSDLYFDYITNIAWKQLNILTVQSTSTSKLFAICTCLFGTGLPVQSTVATKITSCLASHSENWHNEIAPDCIPATVETLVFGADFNQQLNDSWLNKVKRITLGQGYRQPILSETLPAHLTHIHYQNQHHSTNEQMTLILLDNKQTENKHKFNSTMSNYLILNEQLTSGGYLQTSNLSLLSQFQRFRF